MAYRLLEELCGTTAYFQYWVDFSARKTTADGTMGHRLEVTLREHIGTRSGPKPEKHRRGLVAETIWRELAREHAHPLGERRYLSELSGTVTAGGPDGFVAYWDGAGLHWRLWEIKHSAQKPNGAIPATAAAVSQLNTRADGYLSQVVTANQLHPDLALRAMFATLLDDWDAPAPCAGVGVGVVTHAIDLPLEHFNALDADFPNFSAGDQREGLLVGIGAYDEFVDEVCERLWTAR